MTSQATNQSPEGHLCCSWPGNWRLQWIVLVHWPCGRSSRLSTRIALSQVFQRRAAVTLQSSPEVGEVESWWFDDLPKLGVTVICCGDFFLKIQPWFPEHQIAKSKKTKLHFVAVSDRGEHLNLKQQRIHRWNFAAPWRYEVKSRVENMLRRTWITLKKLLWSPLFWLVSCAKISLEAISLLP